MHIIESVRLARTKSKNADAPAIFRFRGNVRPHGGDGGSRKTHLTRRSRPRQEKNLGSLGLSVDLLREDRDSRVPASFHASPANVGNIPHPLGMRSTPMDRRQPLLLNHHFARSVGLSALLMTFVACSKEAPTPPPPAAPAPEQAHAPASFPPLSGFSSLSSLNDFS